MRAWIAFIALVVMAGSAAGQTGSRHFSGEVTSRAPRVSFQIQIEAGQVVTLTTASDELDTVLALNGPNGRQLAMNDDAQPGVLTSRIVQVARETGNYTAIVSGYNGARGQFDLDVSFGAGGDLSSEARVLHEENVTLNRQRPEARYPVDLSAGDIFVATTLALTPNLDTTLTLLDSSGTIVATNDDRGDGTLNSQIIYQAAAAGHYELVAGTYNSAGAGQFALSLALDPRAHAPFNFAAVEGVEIARHEGSLSATQPALEFPVRLEAGQTLYALSEATSGDLDTVLTLSDPDGFPVAINDDRGDGSLNSAFAYTATAAGAYTLELSRYQASNNSGNFRLVLSLVDRSVATELQAIADNSITLTGTEQIIETPNFRVHYTLEGRDATTEAYARATADELEVVLREQVERLGWAAPVRDSDGRYRAYIGQANGNMGYTKPVEMVFDNRNTENVRERAAARAVLVIDNDFRGMGKKAPPESLMRATATHEFNHVVQFGYDSLEGLNWLYEATASWTETVTVGADQDATDYVETDYASPETCWTTNQPGFNYAQWTLLQSLADVYGDRFIVRIWENAVQYDGFETMSRALEGVGTTIPEALKRWRVQNFARDYELAPHFARTVHRAATISREGTLSPRGRIEQLGANYLALLVRGPRTYSVRGENLELVGLGRRDGRIEVVPLGRSGVFDASQFDDAALMVFNNAIPRAPGECSGVSYSITTSAANGAMAAPAYHFSARYFAPPS
ncbi:MAG: PPC domain-containing protein [Hyphomonadaceae bacterium]|nr:PPC domain-containing protein [Hyphomonadaceae bacterium]